MDTETKITERGQRKCAICGAQGRKLYRGYGSFLRESEIFCKEDIPKGYEGWYVGLVEDVDGSVWGYTSAPEEAMDYYNSLPE